MEKVSILDEAATNPLYNKHVLGDVDNSQKYFYMYSYVFPLNTLGLANPASRLTVQPQDMHRVSRMDQQSYHLLSWLLDAENAQESEKTGTEPSGLFPG